MNDVEIYLVKNLEHLDLIIEQVANLIPIGYFYRPDVNNAHFSALRAEIKALKSKSQSSAYKGDSTVDKALKQLHNRYDKELGEVAKTNRQLFVEALQSETDEMKVACLYNVISYYKLLKNLRTFNN